MFNFRTLQQGELDELWFACEGHPENIKAWLEYLRGR